MHGKQYTHIDTYCIFKGEVVLAVVGTEFPLQLCVEKTEININWHEVCTTMMVILIKFYSQHIKVQMKNRKQMPKLVTQKGFCFFLFW